MGEEEWSKTPAEKEHHRVYMRQWSKTEKGKACAERFREKHGCSGAVYYSKVNPDGHRLYQSEYRKKNRTTQKWVAANRIRWNEYQKLWRKEHPTKMKEYSRQFREKKKLENQIQEPVVGLGVCNNVLS